MFAVEMNKSTKAMFFNPGDGEYVTSIKYATETFGNSALHRPID
jgi:hypothetical protein